MFLVIAVAAIASLTVVLSSTRAFAINNAQDDKNNPTFPGGFRNPQPPSQPVEKSAINNCNAHGSGEVGNGHNLPAQCY
jgi:uncharacterized protein YdeI (BOF family)